MTRALDACPEPNPRRVALHISPTAQRQLRQGHPWVYDQAIRVQSHAGAPGDLAVMYDDRNRFLAIGLYDPTSPIRVRILQAREPAPIDARWYRRRLQAALQRRLSLERRGITGLRLVHGENDGLPGVVIDRYDTTLVIKLYTAAWVAHLRRLLSALEETWPATRLILRLGRAVMRQAGALHGLQDGMVLVGSPLRRPLIFQEHGLQFEVDPIHGHKTGFYLDQRDNRTRLERLCADKTVLDACAYTGAFAVYAARGGAREVTSLDISAAALEAARRNMAHNRRVVAATTYQTIVGDAFEHLERLRRNQRRFDVVVLDPPAFANAERDVGAALAAYWRLNTLALNVLQPGGTLVSASCSSHIRPPQFFTVVRQAARKSGRRLRELARTGHPLDHPTTFHEGAYLKCLFAKSVAS